MTHQTVKVEDLVPVVDGDAVPPGQPPRPPADVRREVAPEPADEQQELRDVVPEDMAQQAGLRVGGEVGAVRARDDHAPAGVPPHADVLRGRGDLIQVVDHLVDSVHVLDLLEAVRVLDSDLDGEDEPGRAEAALRRREERRVRLARHAHHRRPREREDEDERAHVRRDDRVGDAAPVRRGRDEPADCLVADAPDVPQRQRGGRRRERRVHRVQRRAGLEGGRAVRVRDLASDKL